MRYACPLNPHLLQVNSGLKNFASLELHLFIHFLINQEGDSESPSFLLYFVKNPLLCNIFLLCC